VSIRRRGKNSWELTSSRGFDRVTGARIRTFHSFKGTKRQAEEEQTRLLHRRDSGLSIEPSKLTVAELLREWLKSRPNLAPKTRQGYEHIVEEHLIPDLGTLRLTNLKPANIQRYFNDKADPEDPGKPKLSSTTLHHHYAVLHAALRYAVKMQYLPYNPSEAVEPPKVRKNEMKVLDQDQLLELLEAARETNLYIPVLIGACTGLRRGEVLGLKWEDIDFSKNQLTVYRSLQRINGETFFKSPKGDRVRTIHIGPDLARELKAHRERQAEVKERMGDDYRDTDLVCTTENGEWLNPGSYSAAFRAFREKLDLPPIRLHDLRHTNATLLLDQRVPLKVVSERLGHSTTKLTGDTYAHVLEGQDQQAAKVFDLALRRARKKTSKANGGS